MSLDLNAAKKSFLVVDDFENARKSMRCMLQRMGVAEVVEARDANSAYKAMKNGQFDVILCDYNLGEGKDGQQLLESVRSENVISYRTLFVMITAETTKSMVMGAVEYEPDDYMAKPFASDSLTNRLSRWIKRQDAMSAILKALDLKDDEAVVLTCQAVIQTMPRYKAWAQRQKIDALMRLKKLDEAHAELLVAQEEREQPWISFNLARILYMKESYQKSINLLNPIVEKSPNFIKAYDLLAVCFQKMNRIDEAYSALSEGIKISPKSFHRQKKFGDLSTRTENFDAAIRAYKNVIKQAENTKYDQPDNYNQLIKALKSAEEHEDVASGRARYRKEIGRAVDKMVTQYPKDANVAIRAQIEKIDLAAAQLKKNLMLKLADQAKGKLEEIEQPTLLHILQTFYNYDETDIGNDWAEGLMSGFSEDKNFVVQIKDMLAEPISEADKERARQLNKQAVTLYKENQYYDAINLYTQAIEISPKHPGLVLNFTQALLQLANQNDNPVERLELASDLLHRLDFLTPLHPSFQRVELLTGKYEKLKEKFHD
jgi:DNA-binding response OmpR family regulator